MCRHVTSVAKVRLEEVTSDSAWCRAEQQSAPRNPTHLRQSTYHQLTYYEIVFTPPDTFETQGKIAG